MVRRLFYLVIILSIVGSCKGDNTIKNEKRISIKEHLIIGYRYLEDGEPLKARNYFLELLNFEPNNGDIYNSIGITYAYEENHDKALEYYIKALELKPDFFPLYNNIGTVYMSRKEYSKALEYFESSIENESNQLCAYLNKGIVLIHYGDIESAHRQFLEIIKRRDDAPVYIYLYAYLSAYLLSPDSFDIIKSELNEVRLSKFRPGFDLLLLSFLRGEMSFEELYEAAGNDKVKLLRANIYMAFDSLTKGDKESALRHFDEVFVLEERYNNIEWQIIERLDVIKSYLEPHR